MRAPIVGALASSADPHGWPSGEVWASGTKNAGAVAFQPSGPSLTRVTLGLDIEPQGLKEKAGEKTGVRLEAESRVTSSASKSSSSPAASRPAPGEGRASRAS